MNFKQPKYTFLVAAVAVIGLFSSMVHYHNENMECLEHSNEAHIVEYDVYCPISTLVSDADFIEPEEFDGYISFDSKIYYENDQILKSFSSTKLGRSPPAIA